MYFAKKAVEEEVDQMMDTTVYACQSESCNGWMREDFVTVDYNCPMCGTGMSEEVRELPKIKYDHQFYNK
ncbi:cold-inducible protein YdjO-related protein [Priestia megaterium]|uniref:cold-inducible protein YdjO-related protein n=1 Tax=Priestia megaterium TaxID=1404 RepID=UPI00209E8835|nr:cold-inducible protein YdjO-related protein [Priestia megaterium]MCP1451644.1 putative RNA-binding Zn-ribbon protein involved in translation (DUF1610 family) [Priestia megaterium]